MPLLKDATQPTDYSKAFEQVGATQERQAERAKMLGDIAASNEAPAVLTGTESQNLADAHERITGEVPVVPTEGKEQQPQA